MISKILIVNSDVRTELLEKKKKQVTFLVVIRYMYIYGEKY